MRTGCAPRQCRARRRGAAAARHRPDIRRPIRLPQQPNGDGVAAARARQRLQRGVQPVRWQWATVAGLAQRGRQRARQSQRQYRLPRQRERRDGDDQAVGPARTAWRNLRRCDAARRQVSIMGRAGRACAGGRLWRGQRDARASHGRAAGCTARIDQGYASRADRGCDCRGRSRHRRQLHRHRPFDDGQFARRRRGADQLRRRAGREWRAGQSRGQRRRDLLLAERQIADRRQHLDGRWRIAPRRYYAPRTARGWIDERRGAGCALRGGDVAAGTGAGDLWRGAGRIDCGQYARGARRAVLGRVRSRSPYSD